MITTIGGQLWGMTLALPNQSTSYIHKIKNYEGFDFIDKISWSNINKTLSTNNTFTNNSTRLFFRVGTDNHSESINDYTLNEVENETNINDVVSIGIGDSNIENGVAHYNFTLTNNSQNNVSIGEIGLIECMGSPINIDGASRKKFFLMSRFALSKKLNLSAGEVKSFSANFGFN